MLDMPAVTSAKKVRLKAGQAYKLATAIKSHCDEKDTPRFVGYAAAADHFSKLPGFPICAKNVVTACKAAEVTTLVRQQQRDKSTLAKQAKLLADAMSRIALLESRVAELESLIKS